MSSEISQAIRGAFINAERILIVSHIRPDGDAIGATIGLGLALQAAGKTVQMVLADGLPRSFRFLKGSELVQRRIKGEFDLSVVLDCSDLLRTSGALANQQPDINIDHHITNLNFARLNLVMPEAVATSAILAEFLPEWGFEVSTEVASALLTGVVSDTLGFRTSNITAQALHQAGNLVEKGAYLPELYNQALVRRSYEAALYWGQGLSRLIRKDRLIWTSLTLEDRLKAGYTGNDDADLINVLSTIDETDLSMIFVEQKDGRVKVSWRAQPGVDVSQIAIQFGGGGHAAASGAEIQGSLKEVQEKVLLATMNLLENNSNLKNVNLNTVASKLAQGS
ncbi:MAG: DHH family phosphoesterase [Anaerolineaceae bacterium]